MSSSSPINRQGTPIKKAPRSSTLRACERCRRRKSKCDEYFPCANCTRLGVQCHMGEGKERPERHQSILEERVKRLEGLLAASLANQVPQHGVDFNPAPDEGPSKLRLQIPTSPASSFPYEQDVAFNFTPDSMMGPAQGNLYQSPSSSGYSTPLDIPQWSSQIFNGNPDPNSFILSPNPRRRAHSFPLSMDNAVAAREMPQANFNQFPNTNIDNNLLSPDIPTIEITSWDTQSNFSYAEPGPTDYSLVPPDLSVGSWSGPPSPSLTAASHGYGFDDAASYSFHSRGHSRRSSFALSDRSFDGFDSLKPDSSDSSSRYRSPEPASAPQSATSNPSGADPLFQTILDAQQILYARTFFESIGVYFPVMSEPDFMAIAKSSSLTNFNNHPSPPNLERASVLLILAVGSRIQSELGACTVATSTKYYTQARHSLPLNDWSSSSSLRSIRAHILLAIYLEISSSPTEARAISPYMLNAHIGASCIDIDLHRHCSSECDRNLMFSAYVLDRTLSILQGKPNVLHDEDIARPVLEGINETVHARRAQLQQELGGKTWQTGCGRLLEWYKLGASTDSGVGMAIPSIGIDREVM
ncbi:hypothetical protein PVAG01_03751 [Phlyctema vagabunda]|uniref:Zn(2)-C6 fungal-type domain-containing protein n=1 Tax=Phlyctema vagabunda TaxID=108571 RepID=A0ABR4PMA7_9HELO